MSSPTTCFVLGGKGFIGSAVVQYLTELGTEVHAITRQNYADYVGQSCDLLVNANGNSKKFLAWKDPKEDYRLSVQSVMDSLHDFQSETYVYLSSIDVYSKLDEPDDNKESSYIDNSTISPYGFHKLAAEALVKKYSKQWLILRMGGFVGPGLWKNPIFDIIHDAPLRVHPQSEYQYMNTDDLGPAMTALIEANRLNETFNLIGTDVVKIEDVITWACKEQPTADVIQKLRVERYEISSAKVNGVIAIPSSAEVVKQFVESEIAGTDA